MPSTVIVDTRAVIKDALRSPLLEEQELVQEFAREEGLRQEAIHQAERSGGWTSVQEAKMIMGRHFVGLAQIIDRFNLGLAPSDVRGLDFVPYPKDFLWKLHWSHLLIAGVPVSMLETRQAAYRKVVAKLGDFSYDSQHFATRRMVARWYLVSKDIASGSLYKTMQEHDARIFNDPMCERLGAPETAYVVAVARLLASEQMLRNVAAFTSDFILEEQGDEAKRRGIPPKKWPVFVGFSGEFGVGVGTCPGDRPMANIGALVSVRPCRKQ